MENPFLPACFVLNLFVSRAETTTMWSAKLKRCFFCNNCRVHSSVYKCIWLISILSSPYFALYQGQVQRRLHPLLSEALLPLPSVNIDSNKWGPKEALQQVQSISRFGLLFIVLFYIKLTSTTFFVLNSNEQLFFFFVQVHAGPGGHAWFQTIFLLLLHVAICVTRYPGGAHCCHSHWDGCQSCRIQCLGGGRGQFLFAMFLCVIQTRGKSKEEV